MPDECRPPDGTPHFTPCVLVNSSGKRMVIHWVAFHGQSPGWQTPTFRRVKPAPMAALGWRFHSLAEVPHD